LKEFDVCFIGIVPLKTDARMLNMLRTLAAAGKYVCCIAFGEESEKAEFLKEGIVFLPVRDISPVRAWKLWLHFLKEASRFKKDISAKNYVAADIFCLPLARNFSKFHSKKTFKRKFFYDAREIYSALGSLAKNPLKQKFFTQFEKYYVKFCDGILTSGELDADFLQKHFLLKTRPTVYLNVPPFKNAVPSNIIREKFFLKDSTKILLYQGMISAGRGLIPAIRALPFLKNAVLCIIGDGDFKSEILKEAELLKVEDCVIFAGRIPYDELHAWTCAADAGLSFIEPISLSYEFALPNKLFEYTMAEIPSLVSDLPALKNVLKDYKIGEVISADTPPEEVAEAIEKLFKNRDVYVPECRRAAHVFCREAQAEILLKFF
jgi:glycosyltransferase involved in cell wall biosynthesis